MTSSMVNIKKLIIENFQSHRYTEIDFSGGFNIIFGPSDFGKSAIIRALKWVLYNEPRGTDFIRHGATLAKVTMVLSNGYTIIRERSRSKNSYILIDPEGKNMTFEGFGNEIPAEIIKAHGIPKYELDSDSSSSLNIGEQLEGPFLLSETGAVRAKAIGKLIGLHIIDKAIRNCNLDIRRENQIEEKTRNDLTEVETKLSEYKYLDMVGEKLKESGALIDKTERLIVKLKRLESLNRDYSEVTGELSSIKAKFERLNKLKECEIDLKTCEIDLKNLDKLLKIKDISREIELETVNLSEVLAKTSNLEQSSDILNQLLKRKNNLDRFDKLKTSADKIDREIKSSEKQLEKTENAAQLEQLIIKSQEKSDKVLKMTSVLERIKDNLLRSAEQEKVLKYSIKVDQYIEMTNMIDRKIQRLNKIENVKSQLDDKNHRLNEGIKYITSCQKDIVKYASECARLLKEAGECPMCGNKISGATLDDILKHYQEV